MSRPRALLLGTGLALLPVLALAPAASADAVITTPGDGTAFDQDTTVRLEARVDARTATTTMQVVEPGGTVHTVDTAARDFQNAQTLSFGLDTSCPAYPGLGCTGRHPAPNGTWTVRLTGGSTDSRAFSLRIAPRAPEVSGSADGTRSVVLTWPRGEEPDLLGYTVVDGSGAKLADVDASCPGGTCRSTVTYDADGPSTDTLAVRAARACPDCGSPLTTTSAPVRVDRPAPPAPEQTASPGDGTGSTAGSTGGSTSPGGSTGGTNTGGSGTGSSGNGGSGSGPTTVPTDGSTPSPGAGGTDGGGTGGSTGGGTGPGATAPGGGTGPDISTDTPGATDPAQSAQAFALTFHAFAPKLGLPKLPPLPATGVALPSVATRLPDGTYVPTLPFGKTTAGEESPPSASGPVGRVTGAVSSVLDTDRLVRSAAGALVLLLAGAHVRRFLGQDTPDQ